MTAHKIDNMASWFLESLSAAQILYINEKAIQKATKTAFGVFQDKVLFWNIILRLNFTREAIVSFRVCLQIQNMA